LKIKGELIVLLPKVRKGTEDSSKIEESLRKFNDKCLTDGIQTFLQSYANLHINSLLSLSELNISFLSKDLRTLFRDEPNKTILILFYSDDLVKKSETVWENTLDNFIFMIRDKKENELFFCCDLKLNSLIKNVEEICIRKYILSSAMSNATLISNQIEIFNFSSGQRIECQLKDGKRTGKGTYYWSNGDRYEGDFVANIRNGKGTYYFPNGNKYEGDFEDNKATCKGTFYWPNGVRYEGDFVDGILTGKGKLKVNLR